MNYLRTFGCYMSRLSRSAWRSVQDKMTCVKDREFLWLSVHTQIVSSQLTNSLEESAPWEANSSRASHGIFYIYGTRRFISAFTTACYFFPVFSHMYLLPPLPPLYFCCKFHFNIVLASAISKRHALAFPTTSVRMSLLYLACHMSHPSIRSGEEYRLRSGALRGFLQPPSGPAATLVYPRPIHVVIDALVLCVCVCVVQTVWAVSCWKCAARSDGHGNGVCVNFGRYHMVRRPFVSL